MRTEQISIDGQEYTINTYFEQRNNCSASIRKHTINIRIPLGIPREEQFRQVMTMKQWVIKKICKHPERFRSAPLRQYKDGDVLKLNNAEFLLRVAYASKASSSARLDGNTILLSIADSLREEKQQEHISTLLSRIIAAQRLPALSEKIKMLNDEHFQFPLRRIFFKNHKSKWGSCSSKGNINISTRLLFAPDDVLEYVCIHELAHLKEHNHSDAFWALIKNVMPDFEAKRNWLKENGNKCAF